MTARSSALHAIRDEQFVCLGGPESACHWYPSCDCEYWGDERHDQSQPEHDNVQQDECWIASWPDNVGLDDTWAGTYSGSVVYADPRQKDEDGCPDGPWPDGLVDWEWTGDDVIWWYTTNPPTPLPGDAEAARRGALRGAGA